MIKNAGIVLMMACGAVKLCATPQPARRHGVTRRNLVGDHRPKTLKFLACDSASYYEQQQHHRSTLSPIVHRRRDVCLSMDVAHIIAFKHGNELHVVAVAIGS